MKLFVTLCPTEHKLLIASKLFQIKSVGARLILMPQTTKLLELKREPFLSQFAVYRRDPRHTKICFVQKPRDCRKGEGLRVVYDITGTGGSKLLDVEPPGCLLQDRSPVTAYLSHLPPWCVGVRGPAAVASTYKVWRVAPSAWVGGPALLRLYVSLWSALCPLTAALVAASVASVASAAWLALAVALVILWVVSTAGRAPPAREAPVAVPVGGVLAPLDWNASWASDIGRLCSL